MRARITSLGCMGALSCAILCVLGLCEAARGENPIQELITLDPTCALAASRNPQLLPGNPAPSTRRMAQRLAENLEKADPAAMAYLSDRMVLMLEQKMTHATEIGEKFRLQFGLGIQQMQAGRPDSALNTFAALERSVQESGGRFDDRTRAGLRMRKAMAFLRLGEQ